VISNLVVNGRQSDSAAAAVAGVSPADIKELQPARLPLQWESCSR